MSTRFEGARTIIPEEEKNGGPGERPKSLAEELAERRARIAKLQQELAQKQREMEELNAENEGRGQASADNGGRHERTDAPEEEPEPADLDLSGTSLPDFSADRIESVDYFVAAFQDDVVALIDWSKTRQQELRDATKALGLVLMKWRTQNQTPLAGEAQNRWFTRNSERITKAMAEVAHTLHEQRERLSIRLDYANRQRQKAEAERAAGRGGKRGERHHEKDRERPAGNERRTESGTKRPENGPERDFRIDFDPLPRFNADSDHGEYTLPDHNFDRERLKIWKRAQETKLDAARNELNNEMKRRLFHPNDPAEAAGVEGWFRRQDHALLEQVKELISRNSDTLERLQQVFMDALSGAGTGRSAGGAREEWGTSGTNTRTEKPSPGKESVEQTAITRLGITPAEYETVTRGEAMSERNLIALAERVFGVKHDRKEMKSAYRRLVKGLHTDRQNTDPVLDIQLKFVNVLYETYEKRFG